MKFDVIVGNPPYQLSDGGFGESARPIYHLFVEQAKKLNPRYLTMIIPSRWFAGGKGLDEFRAAMLHDQRISHLVDYPKLYDGFPGVKIRGGISYFLWDRDHNGPCSVQTMWDGEPLGPPMERRLDAYDVLVRRNEAVSILEKVRAYRSEASPEPTLDKRVSSRKPFGLPTNFRYRKFEQGLEHPVQALWVTAHLLGGAFSYPKPNTGVDRRLEGPDDRRARDQRRRGNDVPEQPNHRWARHGMHGDLPRRRALRHREVGAAVCGIPADEVRAVSRVAAQGYAARESRCLRLRTRCPPQPCVDRRGSLRTLRVDERRDRIHRVHGEPDASAGMSMDFFPPRPASRPTIYAYEDTHPQYEGLLKVGYTTVDAQSRVAQQYPTLRPGKSPYRIVLEESAMRSDGTVFTDHDVHRMLRLNGVKNPKGEWFLCTVAQVKSAIIAVRTGQLNEENRSLDFTMRPEQEAAVAKTAAYFASWRSEKDNRNKPPHFLWNAKMRFGKTFAAYQLAKQMHWRKVLVLTFKPAVQSAWEEDLKCHVDFKGWQFISSGGLSYEEADKKKPFVCFGSFQDYLGRNPSTGGIKTKNEWVHTTNWDCVIHG